MKVLSVHLENFASYKELDFNFQDQGLTLIHGATGSGKSTLCDAIPWALFGRTAKNGAVDEVLSWQGGATKGIITIVGNDLLTVVRIRGSKVNDLYFKSPTNPEPIRGKDIPDTQKLINSLLGFDIELYLSGAYFHEFSQTAQFFTTTAKNRRTITEQLVDLSLPKSVTEKATLELKSLKIQLSQALSQISNLESTSSYTSRLISEETIRASVWEDIRKNKIATLTGKAEEFEKTRQRNIQDLQAEQKALNLEPNQYFLDQIDELKALLPQDLESCTECGALKKNTLKDEIDAHIHKVKEMQSINASNLRLNSSLSKQIETFSTTRNPYSSEIDEVLDTTNTHGPTVEKLKSDLNKTTADLLSLNTLQSILKLKQSDLETLQDVTSAFRSHLIKNTIDSIQDKTNSLLTDYFDGEIRIELAVEDSDKLEVVIAKDGNIAQFTQLSKGQRQILKLTFAIAVMQAIQQFHSVNFEQLYLDEALDGLDDNFKQKAYRLLEALSLSYNSVYVVEHSSAIKELFHNKIHVELVNGVSELGET